MRPENLNPVLDELYTAFQTNGIQAVSPDALIASPDTGNFSTRGWLSGRRGYLDGVLAASPEGRAAFAITTFGGNDFTTTTNPLVVTGTAPLEVAEIRLNGEPVEVTYPSDFSWALTTWLQPGTNRLVVEGYNRRGERVAGAQDEITVTFTGACRLPTNGEVIITEIMYDAAAPGGDFVEIFNRSPETAYDLSGWRLTGADFVFRSGCSIGPTQFLVVAENLTAYAANYTNVEKVAGVYSGRLDRAGETLRLLMPVAPGRWFEVNAVAYGTSSPWPAGVGGSLQVVDISQDNRRVGNWTAVAPGGPVEPWTPGRPDSVAAGGLAFPPVWINEIMPVNASVAADNLGEIEPWLELYNAGTTAVDLSDCYLSDDCENLQKWSFPEGTILEPGRWLVVWLDGQTNQSAPGAPHAGFRLREASGSVVLSLRWGSGVAVLDHVAYSDLTADVAYGDYPDGAPLRRQVFYFPTPGGANVASGAACAVRINEWMADNGNLADWFELYNAGANDAYLGGYALADNLEGRGRCTLPGGWLPAGAFQVIWADGQSVSVTSKEWHVNFKLDRDGEALALFSPDGTLVDGVSFGAQTRGVSEGRWPDGHGAIYRLAEPTPGASNVVFHIRALKSGRERGSMEVEWCGKAGKVYRVDSCDDLASGIWTLSGLVTARESTVRFIDLHLENKPRLFYRIRAY